MKKLILLIIFTATTCINTTRATLDTEMLALAHAAIQNGTHTKPTPYQDKFNGAVDNSHIKTIVVKVCPNVADSNRTLYVRATGNCTPSTQPLSTEIEKFAAGQIKNWYGWGYPVASLKSGKTICEKAKDGLTFTCSFDTQLNHDTKKLIEERIQKEKEAATAYRVYAAVNNSVKKAKEWYNQRRKSSPEKTLDNNKHGSQSSYDAYYGWCN